MVVLVRLGEWAWLVISLHSGAAAQLRFTEQQKQSASDIVIHSYTVVAHGEYQ